MSRITLPARLFCLLFCLQLLQACSTAPQTRNLTPYFDGIIKYNSEAVENAKILLSRKGDDTLCLQPSLSTVTDKDGRFSLKPIQQQQKYVPFVNYEFNEWVVCAEYNGQRYTLYANNQYDTGHMSQSVFLDCELTEVRPNRPCKTRR